MTPQERKVMQMALDALEHGLPIIEDFGGKEQLQIQHKAISALYEALRAALAQPKQEPVGTVYDAYDTTGIEWNCKDAPAIGTLLYTAPPQRDFIGLTDKERDEICLGDEAIARAIEAKLKERNT